MQEKTGNWVPADYNETQYSVGHYGWKLIEHEAYLEVQDPGLGSFSIGDRPEAPLIRDIVMSPLGMRGLSVTQLSKLKQHAPIPNIYDFYRTGHVLGNYEGVRRLAEKHPAKTTEKQRLSWCLSVMLDDLSHGIASHLSDMIIEGGYGGREEAHQERAEEAWQYGGVEEALIKRGIRVDKEGNIKGHDRPPWVESSAPNLCYERIQYTAEEMRLWLESEDTDPAADTIINSLYDLDNLVITDEEQLAFKDEEAALLFAKAYMLLSTEDWNEPVNRVIEHLIINAFKYGVYSRRLPDMQTYDNGETSAVGSYTYAIDEDLQHALKTSKDNRDDFMFAISHLLSQIGKEERWRFGEYKLPSFKRFLLDSRAQDYPSSWLNGHMMEYGPPSSAVEVDVKLPKTRVKPKPTVRANAASLIHADSGGVMYGLQPMKNRYVDPLVITAKGPKPLSKINRRFSELQQQHAQVQASEMTVRLAVSSEYERLIKEVVERNEVQDNIPRKPLERDQLRWQIDAAAARSRAAAIQAGRLVINAP